MCAVQHAQPADLMAWRQWILGHNMTFQPREQGGGGADAKPWCSVTASDSTCVFSPKVEADWVMLCLACHCWTMVT